MSGSGAFLKQKGATMSCQICSSLGSPFWRKTDPLSRFLPFSPSFRPICLELLQIFALFYSQIFLILSSSFCSSFSQCKYFHQLVLLSISLCIYKFRFSFFYFKPLLLLWVKIFLSFYFILHLIVTFSCPILAKCYTQTISFHNFFNL